MDPVRWLIRMIRPGPPDLQDPERAALHRSAQAPGPGDALMRPRHHQESRANPQARMTARLW